MTESPAPVEAQADGSALRDMLDFIASIVGSLAWPVVVLLLLLAFRGEVIKLVNAIKERMPSIERVKTPWGEAVWSSSAVQKVTEEVDATLPLRAADTTSRGDVSESVPSRLAQVKPSAGVIDAFLEVEREVRRYLTAVDIPWRGSPMSNFRRVPGVSPQLKHVVSELAVLRNAAAHGVGDISLESALEYTETARRVAGEIALLANEVSSGLAHY